MSWMWGGDSNTDRGLAFRASLRRRSLLIVAAYAGVAGIYIFSSDRLLGAWVSDPRVLVEISVFKGLGFVATTAGLLYLMLRWACGTIEAAFTAVERKEAERLLHEEQRRRADAIVASTDDAIVSRTLDGVITSWNPAAENVFGFSVTEIVGRNVEALVPKDLLEEEALVVGRIKSGERVTQFETYRVRKDGTRLPVSITFSPIWRSQEATNGDPQDRTDIAGVSEIVRDISQRKQAEEALRKSEARYRSTLDSAMQGCQIVDFDWRYLYLNDSAATQNRRPKAELLGKRMLEAWPGIEKTELYAMFERCMQQRIPQQEEIAFTFPSGSSAWFDVRVQPVPEGIFVLSIDISQRKQAESALLEFNQCLERTIAERTRELEAARERAEAADKIKSAFLATMSHELRTPLNSIIGFTGILLQGMAGPLTAEQSKQLGMVQVSSKHLLALLNDVLDISKIEAGQLEVCSTPFELTASIRRIVASLSPFADSKGLRLDVVMPQESIRMESDQRRVEQILLNLLNNALKFTDRGVVTLSTELARAPQHTSANEARPTVQIRVNDTGVGMKADSLCQLFQPFQQIDAGPERRHEGTGLGLAICRRLTRLLGGTIGVESIWGKGSEFTVALPTKLVIDEPLQPDRPTDIHS